VRGARDETHVPTATPARVHHALGGGGRVRKGASSLPPRPGYVLVGNLKGVGRIYQQTFIDTYTKVSFAKLYDRKTPITVADLLSDRVLPFFEEEAALVRTPSSMLFLTTGAGSSMSPLSRTAQMEINVCSDMAQTCWVAIPRLYSNGHRRERPTTY
jgi:hypothetical protein